jgi:hypothetical protein
MRLRMDAREIHKVRGSIGLFDHHPSPLVFTVFFSSANRRTVGAFLAHELAREAEVAVQTAQQSARFRGFSLAVLRKLALRVWVHH